MTSLYTTWPMLLLDDEQLNVQLMSSAQAMLRYAVVNAKLEGRREAILTFNLMLHSLNGACRIQWYRGSCLFRQFVAKSHCGVGGAGMKGKHATKQAQVNTHVELKTTTVNQCINDHTS